MPAHALLSPSSSHRWYYCTPSVRLEEKFKNQDSFESAEGTLAHALAELLLRLYFNLVKPYAFQQKLQLIKDTTFHNGTEEIKLYNKEMQEHCEAYRDFVIERYAEALAHTPDAKIFFEARVDLTEWLPEGFGTIDVRIVSDFMLEIIDFKYGKGVRVEVAENKQLLVYALGAYRTVDLLYGMQMIRITVYQPRMDNFDSYEITVKGLIRWGDKQLRPRAEQAFKGEGEFVPGKHCGFCRARAVCKAFADHNLELAKHAFASPDLLEDVDVSDILDRKKMFEGWLKAVSEYATSKALEGYQWPGYKLVEGRSNRKYSDEKKIAKELMKEGFKEDSIYTKELLTLMELEKLVGIVIAKKHIAPNVIKPTGKPTLVPLNDKRPQFNGIEAAKEAFKDYAEEGIYTADGIKKKQLQDELLD